MAKGESTRTGYVNKNKQRNEGSLGIAGTDHGQTLYAMCCQHCRTVYAANGSDIWQRKCPRCQGGQPSSGDWVPG